MLVIDHEAVGKHRECMIRCLQNHGRLVKQLIDHQILANVVIRLLHAVGELT
jgi:hypothetical protein